MGGGNSYYDLNDRNCTQVTMQLFCLGTLPDGTNVGDYIKSNNVTISVLPNTNMKQMQRIFYNTATNITEFNNSINYKINEFYKLDPKNKKAYGKRIMNLNTIK